MNKLRIKGNEVVVGCDVSMTIYELSDLFEVSVSMIRGQIYKAIKRGVVVAYPELGGTLYRALILPDFYGLDVIFTLAFHLDSHNAKLLREWLVSKVDRDYSGYATIR
ncbi:MAG: hypothetical protein SNH79_06300 [Rikenellaceae bacterium]